MALALTALVAAGRPPTPGAAVAAYLPTSPTTRLHADVEGGGAWQVNQGVLPAAEAWDELSLLARRHLETVGSGQWFTVDVIAPDPRAGRISLDLEVAEDALALRVITTADRSLAFEPGVPVLDPALAAGGTTTWSGALTVDDGDPVPAEVDVTSATVPDQAVCIEVTLSVTAPEVREVLTWCTGERAGLAAWRTESPTGTSGFTAELGTRDPGPDPVDLDETPTESVSGNVVEQIRFFRVIVGSYREQRPPFGSRVTWAADQLVIADTAGRVTSWLPISDEDEPESLYTQVWRVQPGGSVRGLVNVGAVTVLGTTNREVVAYDRDGWELWRRDVADAVTQVARAGDDTVLVVDAGGDLLALDALSGELRWQLPEVQQILDVDGTSETALVTAEGALRVVDLDNGEETWSVTFDTEEGSAVVVDDLVALVERSWLVARDRGTGSHAWVRTVPNDTILYATADGVLVSEPSTARVLDASGTETWRSSGDMPIVVPLGGSELLGVLPDHLVLEGPEVPTLTWTYPSDAREPELTPQRGDHGVITMQRVGSDFLWWEYR